VTYVPQPIDRNKFPVKEARFGVRNDHGVGVIHSDCDILLKTTHLLSDAAMKCVGRPPPQKSLRYRCDPHLGALRRGQSGKSRLFFFFSVSDYFSLQPR